MSRIWAHPGGASEHPFLGNSHTSPTSHASRMTFVGCITTRLLYGCASHWPVDSSSISIVNNFSTVSLVANKKRNRWCSFWSYSQQIQLLSKITSTFATFLVEGLLPEWHKTVEMHIHEDSGVTFVNLTTMLTKFIRAYTGQQFKSEKSITVVSTTHVANDDNQHVIENNRVRFGQAFDEKDLLAIFKHLATKERFRDSYKRF